jgi:hypothetical protein
VAGESALREGWGVRVLEETAEHFDFEIRGLHIKDELLLVFYIKPEDGFKLPQIFNELYGGLVSGIPEELRPRKSADR